MNSRNTMSRNTRTAGVRHFLAIAALTAGVSLLGAATGAAQVTGDFKVTAVGYTNDVAMVGGTLNRGAIQSGKNVVVEVSYEYSFVAEKTVTTSGETMSVLVFVPGRCTTLGCAATADAACYHQSGPDAGQAKALNGAIWVGQYQTQTVTTEAQTITHTFSGASGMTAITEPTIEKGRLNPKGKITGYNWVSNQSIVPNASLVDPSLVPEGYTVALPGSTTASSTSTLRREIRSTQRGSCPPTNPGTTCIRMTPGTRQWPTRSTCRSSRAEASDGLNARECGARGRHRPTLLPRVSDDATVVVLTREQACPGGSRKPYGTCR